MFNIKTFLGNRLWLVEQFLVVNRCLTITAVEMKNLSNKHSFHLNKLNILWYCNYERPFCNIFIDSYIERNRMNDQVAWHRQQGQKSQRSQGQMGFPYLGTLLFYHWWKHSYFASHRKSPANRFSLWQMINQPFRYHFRAKTVSKLLVQNRSWVQEERNSKMDSFGLEDVESHKHGPFHESSSLRIIFRQKNIVLP